MIEKNEITTIASKLGLSVETVQKDYVLSWVLWGINNHKKLHEDWIFKGGTSLKKCFFEGYRFSEDLDFTLTNEDHLNIEFLKKIFFEIADAIYNETGIMFYRDKFKFELIPKENGKMSGQVLIHYNSPLKVNPNSTPRISSIKLDLTNDEIVLLQPEKKSVHHPYSDEPSTGIWATCYPLEEVMAEKIRALSQRARPRDLYDVVHFYRNRNLIANPLLAYELLKEKCRYKKTAVPRLSAIVAHEKIGELHSEWRNMLAHQLPSLAPIDSFLADLEPFFEWFTGGVKE